MKIIRYVLTFTLLFIPILGQSGPLVNVNTADVYELTDDLIGMEQSQAQAIVDYREKHGPFTAKEDMLNVKDLGRDFLNINDDYIYLSDEAIQARKQQVVKNK